MTTRIKAVREKNGVVLVKGLQMLSDNEGDAFVSAGNTGALVTGTTLL
jgi:glycerol-3-phosphate acyltransferase PlsX